MKKIITILCAVVAICNAAYAQAPVLKFNKDGKFKILQITDTHINPGQECSVIAMERMNEVLDAEKPDFVIYSGDLIYGRPADKALFQAIEPVVTRGIPFSVVWGNHDDEFELNRQQLFNLIKDVPNNLTGTTEGITGVTNYILPIKDSKGKKDAFIMYFIDSNAFSTLDAVDRHGWVAHDQVIWFEEQSKALTEANGGVPYPAMAFQHIPVPEFHEGYLNEAAFVMGTRKEKPASPKVNSGLALAMLEAGDVMAMVAGHDHVNNYVASWYGMMLIYGHYTGGTNVYDDIPGGNGARVFELTEGERSFKTWIRLKNGRIINEFQYPGDIEWEKDW